MTLEEVKAFFSNDRVAMDMGCVILEADSTHSVVRIDIEEKHYNGNNCVQGGVMFTLADFACAVAANADEIAYVSAVYSDGVSLIFAGQSAGSTKHYPANKDVTFKAGDKVLIYKASGTYVVVCRI